MVSFDKISKIYSIFNLNKIDRDSKNPLSKSRVSTNAAFISIPILFSITWIGILIYALSNSFVSSGIESFVERIINYNEIMTNFTKSFESDKNFDGVLELLYISLWFSCFGGFLCLYFLFMIRSMPKRRINFLLMCAYAIFILSAPYYAWKTCEKIYSQFKNDHSANIVGIVVDNAYSVMVLTYAVINIICMFRVETSVIIQYTLKSLRALFFYPSLFAFGLLILMLQLTTIILTAWCIQKWLGTFALLKLIMFFGGTYINVFLYCFGSMVIYEAIGTWYWVEDKEIPARIIPKCISTVIRYHLGSIAFHATIIMPIFVGIYILVKNKCYKYQKDEDFITRCCKCLLAILCTDYTLIQTSLHGLSYFEASKKTFHLMVKNSNLSLVLIFSSINLVLFVEEISCITCTLFYDYFHLNYDQNSSGLGSSFLSYFLYILLPVNIVVQGSFNTTILCMLEDKEDNEISEESQCIKTRYQ